MKVNHIVIDDCYGAGRAAVRISNALDKYIESNVYVLNKQRLDGSRSICLTIFEKIKKKIYNRINYELVKKYARRIPFNVEFFGSVYKDIDYLDADIIHLHYVNHGLWSDRFAHRLLEINKPIVWTLHDMWPYTGGCHYNGECENYINGCGKCVLLNSNDERDLSNKAICKKKRYVDKLNIQFVGCSKWIADEANRSYVMRDCIRRSVSIPNPILDKPFTFIGKENARRLLGINTEKKIICFGAQSATSDKRKGYHFLKEALLQLDPKKYFLLIFGTEDTDDQIEFYEKLLLGKISNDIELSCVYNSADVFVAPSLQENLANTVMESLACGTPVVAFDIGGMPDMVNHRINGYLAIPYKTDDLAKGIECSTQITDSEQISKNTHTCFSVDVIANKYLDLYREMRKGFYD